MKSRTHGPSPEQRQVALRRRELEEAFHDVRQDLEGAVGWAPRGRGTKLLFLAACAGFALAGWRLLGGKAGPPRDESRGYKPPPAEAGS